MLTRPCCSFPKVWRASKAVLSGVDYKKSLRESLSQIQISSNALIQEAQTSNIKQIRDLWAQVRNCKHTAPSVAALLL